MGQLSTHFRHYFRNLLGTRRVRSSARRQALVSAFQDSERELFVTKYVGKSNLVGAMVAILSFSIVDYFLTPDMWSSFLAARLLVIPATLCCWLAYKSKAFHGRFYAVPALGANIYLGCLIGYVSAHSGYESSLHFMGLLLIVSSAAHFSWPPKYLFLAALFSSAPFFANILLRWPETNRAVFFADVMVFQGALTLNLGFYSAARRLRRTDFFRRLKLKNRNFKQKVLIEQKTREGIYLERLASQFSPQVIDSIKSGTLDLEARVRRPVACIFVDVQNSTNRASRIDHHNYTNLMAAFFEDCVKIFLRHNVTVGTYLGDGILAFTNAPTEDKEYQRNALNACLEILQLHERKQKIYFETWRTDFNIRVGIDSGFATVGFFPSREHGTYTALGETVSLAARLCARAETNSIAITKKFLTSVKFEDGSLVLSRLSTAVDIKGLEGECFEVYSVRAPARKAMAESHCPSCAIPMTRESEQIGAVFYRCSECSYRELLPDPVAEARNNVQSIIGKKAA